MHTLFLTPGHARRAEAERLIRAVYQETYGATLTQFPQTLAAAVGPQGHILAAAGLRYAPTGFFSETYLDEAIEDLLTKRDGIKISRVQVLEVTTLAAVRPGAVPGLIRAVIEDGRKRGCTWGFFTATARLRNFIKRIGLPFEALQAVDPARVINPHLWGSYCASDPWVLAVRDSDAVPCPLPLPLPANDEGKEDQGIYLSGEAARIGLRQTPGAIRSIAHA